MLLLISHTLIAALAVLRAFVVVEAINVPTASMSPTLVVGDHIFVSW